MELVEFVDVRVSSVVKVQTFPDARLDATKFAEGDSSRIFPTGCP